MAAAKGDDIDIFACYAEPPLVAREPVPPAQRADRGPPRVLLGRPGKFDEPQFFSSLLRQLYLDQQFIPSEIHVPVDFEDREALEELLTEKRNRRSRSARRSADRRRR